MKKVEITKEQARRFMLAHQGLYPPRGLKGKAGILEHIGKVGCIQFDPLDIAGHNQELVLQSRIKDFKPAMLQELLYKDRKLLDGWDKMMSIYKVEDWPYFKRRRDADLRDLGNASRPIMPFLPQIRKEIRENGPLSSIDLNFDQTVDWPWAPTRVSRAALESMYFWGELIIHHKVHTRKVYDFADRHISDELLYAPDPNAAVEQYFDWHVMRRIGGIGLLWNKSGESWLGIMGLKSTERSRSIDRLLSKELLTTVDVEGMKVPLYMRSKDKPVLEQIIEKGSANPSAAVIAPLDNLLWDRRLVKEIFDFDYRWEVYKPQTERKYGYYVLPVLYGDRFAARFEPGWDKKENALVIKNWWWEPGVKPSKKTQNAMTKCFKQFIGYLDASRIIPGDKLEASGLEWISELSNPSPI